MMPTPPSLSMHNHLGVAARFFRILAKHDIPIHIVTTSEIKISAVIDQKHLAISAAALHTEFSLDGTDDA